MKICSACLLGINCNYKGKSKPSGRLIEEFNHGEVFPVCPEVLGGQSIPRPNAEISGGSGVDVLEGKARVIEPDGKDVTDEFVKGAEEVLRIAKAIGSKEAIMKQRSPSCGCGQIYDGTFSGNVISGDGVTTALLKKNGIRVISDEDLE